MIIIVFLQFVIVVSLIKASRRGLENALPVASFFLVLMPLESRIVIPGMFDFNTMRITLLTLLVLYFFKRDSGTDEPVPLKWLMFFYVGWEILSTFYSLSFATSVKQLISQVLEYFLLYFIFVKTISSVQTIYKVAFAMSLAIGICCVFGLFEAYAHWSILSIFPSAFWTSHDGGTGPLYIEQGRGLRILATFPHPILFGDALTISIPITLYLLSIWQVRWQRNLLWVCGLLMFWAIYKTSSRGPWVVTGVSCALLFFLARNKVRKYLFVIGMVLLVILIARPGIWQTIEGLYDSTSDANSPIGSSYMYRGALTSAVTNAASAEPQRVLFGYGLGTFRTLGLDIDFLHEVRRWYTCDNNWDLFLYETGYVGLFLISILLAKPLLIAFRSYRKLPKPHNAFSGVLFITLAGFYFSLMTVAGYNWGQQGYMAWILISLTICCPRVLLHEASSEEASHQESRVLNEQYAFHVA
jgi:O-antigen ligase